MGLAAWAEAGLFHGIRPTSSVHSSTPLDQTVCASSASVSAPPPLVAHQRCRPRRLLPGHPLPNDEAVAAHPAVISPRRLELLPVPAGSVLLRATLARLRPPCRRAALAISLRRRDSVQVPDLLPACPSLPACCLLAGVLRCFEIVIVSCMPTCGDELQRWGRFQLF
jgi:hypothetical protein